MASTDKDTSSQAETKENPDRVRSDDDWFLVRCSGCEGILKVPSDTEASSISCPTCDSILQLGLKEEDDENEEADSSDGGDKAANAPTPSIVKFGCPGCGESVRLAIGDPSGVVACRACGQTIEYEFGDTDSSESKESDFGDWDENLPPSSYDADSAIQLDPHREDEMGMFRHTNEFTDESLPKETEDEDLRIKTLPDGRKVRVRRKRKKRRGGQSSSDIETNIVTWDSSSSESSRRYQDLPAGKVRIEISKKRLTSDEVAEIRVLEKTEGSASPALSKHRKRISKADARAKKINKIAFMVIAGFVVSLVVALVGIAIHGGFISAQDSSDMTRIQQDLKVNQEESYQAVLREFDMDKARQVALQYVGADGIEEKLKHVRHPEIVRPLMEKFYTNHSPTALPRAVITGDGYWPDHLHGEIGWVEISDNENDPVVISVLRIGDDYKVDWEVAVGYQEMTMPEIRAKKPTTPVTLACNLLRSKYYNYQFSDKERYLAISIEPVGWTKGKLVGYLERSSELAKEIDSLFAVADNSRFGTIISFKFPENAESDNQVIVLEMLQRGFIRKYAETN